MTEPNRDDEGNYASTVSDDELLAFIAETPTCTAAKIQAALPFDTRQGVGFRLRQLRDEGRVEVVETIGTANVWGVVSSDGSGP